MTDEHNQKISDTTITDFIVKDCALIAIATGNRSVTLKELRDTLLTIGDDSIYYHFWGGLLQARFEEREYNNDFAAWAWYSLHDATLAERLAVIDPTEFAELEKLRQELLEIIEERLEEKEYLPWVIASSSFEFIRSQIVVFDTHKKVANPQELAAILPQLSTSSVFYHFIDARRRLQHGDDFSSWLLHFNDKYGVLCDKLAAIDPYFGSLTQLRTKLVTIFENHFSKEATR